MITKVRERSRWRLPSAGPIGRRNGDALDLSPTSRRAFVPKHLASIHLQPCEACPDFEV